MWNESVKKVLTKWGNQCRTHTLCLNADGCILFVFDPKEHAAEINVTENATCCEFRSYWVPKEEEWEVHTVHLCHLWYELCAILYPSIFNDLTQQSPELKVEAFKLLGDSRACGVLIGFGYWSG